MASQYGVLELKESVVLVAKTLNMLSGLVHKNILSLLQVPNLYIALKGIDFDLLKKEISDLEVSEKDSVFMSFSMALDLQNKDVQNKILATADAIEQALDSIKEILEIIYKSKIVFDNIVTAYNKLKLVYGVK